jgi:hypothetical protein
MKNTIRKYFNIYFVIGFIGVFSFLYMLSFIFVINDINNGSSVEINKAYIQHKKELCKQDPTQC